MIFHIAQRGAWDEARRKGRYESPSLEADGFIHCSEHEQVPAVLRRFFEGERDLVLLAIDPRQLHAAVRYEPAADGTGIYPHVYGPLNLEAVVGVLSLG